MKELEKILKSIPDKIREKIEKNYMYNEKDLKVEYLTGNKTGIYYGNCFLYVY